MTAPVAGLAQTRAWNGEQWKVEHEPASRTDVVFEVQDSELQYLVAELFGAPADRLRHARLIAAAPELLAALHECEAYLSDREDVIDGDYGEPAPNREMTLLMEVRAALSHAEQVKP